MIDKNDPLIGVVQGVMNRNHAEREAAKLVNEKFGIQDRKALPHERQHEWDAAYKSVLTEGINVPDVSYRKTTNPQTGSDRRIMTKDTKNVFSGGTTTLHNVDKSANGTDSVTTKIKSQDLGKNKQLGGKDYNVSTSTVSKKSSTSVDEEALEEKKLVGKQPNIDVASTTGEKKPDGKLTKHDFDHLRSMEEDVTSPSRMGINKPDYAPPGTTPDYAKSKEQTVNRAAKTSLPAGTVAKSIKEAGPGFAGAGSQVKSQSTYGSGPRIGGNSTAVPAARPVVGGVRPTAAPAARPAAVIPKKVTPVRKVAPMAAKVNSTPATSRLR